MTHEWQPRETTLSYRRVLTSCECEKARSRIEASVERDSVCVHPYRGPLPHPKPFTLSNLVTVVTLIPALQENAAVPRRARIQGS